MKKKVKRRTSEDTDHDIPKVINKCEKNLSNALHSMWSSCNNIV